MKVIQPNCRVQFTAEDVDFVVSILGGKTGAAACVVQLLADADTRDLILDDEALFHALLEHRGCLRVSSHFYFYILVRRVLHRAGIEDRVVADYVAEMLAEFSRAENTECRVPGQTGPLNYFFEMDAKSGIPSLQQMVSEGIEVRPRAAPALSLAALTPCRRR